MFFSKALLVFVTLLSASMVLSYPLSETRTIKGDLEARSPAAAKKPAPPPAKKAAPPPAKKGSPAPSKPMQVTSTNQSPESQMRAQNNAPGRVVPKACKKLADCSCPNGKKPGHSTSCINGFCQCDNPIVGAFAGKFIDAVAAIGNAPITKAIGHLMQGLADVKEVIGTIAGAVLGPEAKAALKVALMAFPDTGESHIDQATKKALTKIL